MNLLNTFFFWNELVTFLLGMIGRNFRLWSWSWSCYCTNGLVYITELRHVSLSCINKSVELKKSFTKKSFTKGLQAFYGLPQPLRPGAVRRSVIRFLLYTVTLSAMLIDIGKHNFQHSVVLGGQPVSHQFTAAFCSFLCLLTQNGIEISRQLQITGCWVTAIGRNRKPLENVTRRWKRS